MAPRKTSMTGKGAGGDRLVAPSTSLAVRTPAAAMPGPAEWQAMREMAAILAKTEFVPDALRNRTDAVLAAILKGRELGIGPMQALSQINVIKGKPVMSAELMMAVIRRAGHSIEITEETDVAVTVTAQRADTHDSHVERWDMDRAKLAGLLGKDNWRTYPKAMLRARAISATGRFLFPDVLSGVSYVPEELDATDEYDGAPPVPPVAATVVEPLLSEPSDAQKQRMADLGNSLEPRWAPGKYKARRAALGGDADKVIMELIAEHATQHGDGCEHVRKALAPGNDAA